MSGTSSSSTGGSVIRVLVVEDDPIAAEAHAAYVGRVPGFAVCATVGTGAEALRRSGGADLILLDMNLPDMHGLDVCRALRAGGRAVDVVAVTSARDLPVVQGAVSQGVVQYVLKPFVFATLKDRLERYAAYRAEVAGQGAVAGQEQVDRLFGDLHRPAGVSLPKGLSPEPLEATIAHLRAQPAPVSSDAVGAVLGLSRVTARRYLEYLVESGLATRSSQYGGTGRPWIGFSWRS